MKVLRALSRGLAPVVLIGAVVAVGAWAIRVSIVKRAEKEVSAAREVVATAVVEKGEFSIYVESVGKLAAVQSKSVMTEVSGQVIRIAPNGVELKEGDLVAELDAPRMLRELRDQQESYQEALDSLETKERSLAAEVEQSEISLKKSQRELAQFLLKKELQLADKRDSKAKNEAALKVARERYERQKVLAKEGLVAAQELELADAAIKAQEFALERETKELALLEREKESEELDKKAVVETAESDLARVNSKTESELRNARTAMAIRQTQLDRVKEDFGKSIILSPADGILVLEQQEQSGAQSRPLQAGDQVWENRTIATIPDLTKMRVDLEFGQDDARLIRAGQKAIVTVDAVPGVTFEGKVSDVSQTATESRIGGWIPSGERSFAVRVDITDLKKTVLRPGTTGTARIIIDTLKDVVSVPIECVFEREGKHFVYARRGDDFARVEVKVGERNGGSIVIREGLKGGEEVALRDVGERAGEASPKAQAEGTPAAPPMPQEATE